MAETNSGKVKIELTMYGVDEILKWCVDKNNGRIPDVDTDGFKHMQAALTKKPGKGDYFTLINSGKYRRCLNLPRKRSQPSTGACTKSQTSRANSYRKSAISSGPPKLTEHNRPFLAE